MVPGSSKDHKLSSLVIYEPPNDTACKRVSRWEGPHLAGKVVAICRGEKYPPSPIASINFHLP
jgi:hypothetical protein